MSHGDEPTEEEIDEVLNLAAESIETGKSKWPSMSYEKGVDAAVRWMRGDSDEGPMDE